MLLARWVDCFMEDLFMFRYVKFQRKENPLDAVVMSSLQRDYSLY